MTRNINAVNHDKIPIQIARGYSLEIIYFIKNIKISLFKKFDKFTYP